MFCSSITEAMIMRMQRLQYLNLTFFVLLLVLESFHVHAQDQSGFISIDCGIPMNSSYADTVTGLNYVSDAAFIDTGVTNSIDSGLNTGSIDRQLMYLRNFPDGDRNCYNISVTRGTKYLIRATFFYGNYDGLNNLPTFDLHFGVGKWSGVEILNASNPVYKELIHITTMKYIYVCLMNTGFGVPFISALELRPLVNTSYVTTSGSLVKFTRLNVGSTTNLTVRYPDDVFDRLWAPDHFYKWTDISTSETIDSEGHNDFQPPSTVMQTAGIPTNESEAMELYIDTKDSTLQFYVFMQFAEIVKRQPNETRIFNITLNGKLWYGPTVPNYLYTTSVYSPSALVGGTYRFSLFKAGNSTLPPLLNAIEVYSVVDLSQLLTNQADVNAITSIKSTYNITRNWQGDPCAPVAYGWLGLNCSFDANSAPAVISLNLSSSGLTGEIAPDIANLKSLQVLDLSENNLTGQVPEFLSKLTSLKTLKLNGNNFTGTIPASLLEKSKSGSLSLSIDGNEGQCQSDSCTTKKKKNNVVVPVVAAIAAVAVLVGVATILILSLRRRKKPVSEAGKVEAQNNRNPEPLESAQRQFTYSEVLKMTKNSELVLGKGGFGTVYHGYLEGTEVAVKMLSPSSVQGYKEFHTEVKLLLRVHHRNLTSLVGYCNEGTNLGLVYEYMANGNLENHLAGSNPDVLTWEARLRIALESAQGLEYLHNGCKPPIVHRDVKSTNILLNDKFQAKLADFGLSRIFPTEGGTHVSTIVAGTPGYLDPEYYVTNWLTEKSDVYSFGVVLLEIITSRPVIAKNRERTHISQWVQSILETGDVQSIVDPRLQGDFDISSVWKIVELAMACVSPISAKRPTMSQVVIELNECLTAEMNRTREGFSYQTGSSSSTDGMSVYIHTGLSPLVR